MKRLLVCGLCALLAACGANASQGPGDNGGNTNWLQACDQDADCDGDGRCVSKFCLTPCASADACDDLSATVCTAVSVLAGDSSGECQRAPAADLCALRCERDGDCAALGSAFTCDDGACRPSCAAVTPSPDPVPSAEPSDEPDPSDPSDAGSTPAPSDEDDCVVAMDVSECCPQAFAARRSELDVSECWYEVIDGNYAQPSGLPQHCFPSCVELPCPPWEMPGAFGVAVEDESGTCQLEPSCDDASCPGSPCDPVMGCDANWSNPVGGQGQLQCQADSCGEPGVCTFVEIGGCGEIYAPVCGCDGVTYDNRCSAGDLAPILYEGECEAPTAAPPGSDGTDECVMALNAAECCSEPYAARRGEVDADPCKFEVVDGDASAQGKVPDDCFMTTCPDILCATPVDQLGVFGSVIEQAGSCVLVPSCNDASCVGGPCDPRVGCDPSWSCEGPQCGAGDSLACVADSCDEPGTCRRNPVAQCALEPDPMCGCDGTQFENSCAAGFNPIDFAGLCTE